MWTRRAIVRKGRLGPGEMLTVDTASGEVLTTNDVAGRLAADKPYERWLQENLVKLDDLMTPGGVSSLDHRPQRALRAAYGGVRPTRLPPTATYRRWLATAPACLAPAGSFWLQPRGVGGTVPAHVAAGGRGHWFHGR